MLGAWHLKYCLLHRLFWIQPDIKLSPCSRMMPRYRGRSRTSAPAPACLRESYTDPEPRPSYRSPLWLSPRCRHSTTISSPFPAITSGSILRSVTVGCRGFPDLFPANRTLVAPRAQIRMEGREASRIRSRIEKAQTRAVDSDDSGLALDPAGKSLIFAQYCSRWCSSQSPL
jgi:hypothetical protein